jgi:hypothetical protein
MTGKITHTSLSEINDYLQKNCFRIGVVFEIKNNVIGIWSRIFGYRYAQCNNDCLKLNDLVWFDIKRINSKINNSFFSVDTEIFDVIPISDIQNIKIPYESDWVERQFKEKGILCKGSNNTYDNISILFSESGISIAFVNFKHSELKFFKEGIWTDIKEPDLILLKSKWNVLTELNQESVSNIINPIVDYVDSLDINSITDSFNIRISFENFLSRSSYDGEYKVLKTSFVTSTNLDNFPEDEYLIDFFSVKTATKGRFGTLHNNHEIDQINADVSSNFLEEMNSNEFSKYINDCISFVKLNAKIKYNRQEHINRLLFYKLKKYFENIKYSEHLTEMVREKWELHRAFHEWKCINNSYDTKDKVRALNDTLKTFIKIHLSQNNIPILKNTELQ